MGGRLGDGAYACVAGEDLVVISLSGGEEVGELTLGDGLRVSCSRRLKIIADLKQEKTTIMF